MTDFLDCIPVAITIYGEQMGEGYKAFSPQLHLWTIGRNAEEAGAALHQIIKVHLEAARASCEFNQQEGK